MEHVILMILILILHCAVIPLIIPSVPRILAHLARHQLKPAVAAVEIRERTRLVVVPTIRALHALVLLRVIVLKHKHTAVPPSQMAASQFDSIPRLGMHTLRLHLTIIFPRW